jgi:hypothetical protein
MEMRVDLAVITGDPAEMENHAQEKQEAQAKQEQYCAFKGLCLLRMLQYATKACDTPKDTEEHCESPTEQCPYIITRRRR